MKEQLGLEIPEAIYKEQMDLLLLRSGMLKKAGDELISLFVSESLDESDTDLFTEFLKENPEQLTDVEEYRQFFDACSEAHESINNKVVVPIMRFDRTAEVERGALAADTGKESNEWEILAPKSFVFEINQYLSLQYPTDGIVEKFLECDLSEYIEPSAFLIHTKKSLFLSLLKMPGTESVSIKIDGEEIEKSLISEEIELFKVMDVEDLKWLKVLELEVDSKTVIIRLE